MFSVQISKIRVDEDIAWPPVEDKPGKERSGLVRVERVYFKHGGGVGPLNG